MWIIYLLGLASVNFAIGNVLTGAGLCVAAVTLAGLKQVLGLDQDDEDLDEEYGKPAPFILDPEVDADGNIIPEAILLDQSEAKDRTVLVARRIDR